jgi:L-asparagine transporter-like permease
MVSVNSAIVALYGYLAADKLSVPVPQKTVWLWAIPAAGAIVSIAWTVLLTSYRQLNRAKFAVLEEIEKDLPVQPFACERALYSRENIAATFFWFGACGPAVAIFVPEPLIEVRIGAGDPYLQILKVRQFWSTFSGHRSCRWA